MTLTHRDIHAILAGYLLPATYQATIETDIGPDPEGADTVISDLEARKIASEWHGGGGTALYAFASTGSINTARADHDLENEVLGCVNGALSPQDKSDTLALLAYIRRYTDHHGARGPQPGWNDLTW
jgi:hypothetical protein